MIRKLLPIRQRFGDPVQVLPAVHPLQDGEAAPAELLHRLLRIGGGKGILEPEDKLVFLFQELRLVRCQQGAVAADVRQERIRQDIERRRR